MRFKVDRANCARTRSFPVRPVGGELEAFGLRALDAVGARLALIFLATALAGISLANPDEVGRVVFPGVVIFICAAGITVVLVRKEATPWVVALMVATSVATSLLASLPPGITWDQSHTLQAWVVAGMASGVAASRGPAWGLVVFVPAVMSGLGVEWAHGGPASALIFLGSFTYYVGASVTYVLARRGFATTERALEAVEAARAAQRVAEERWQARRKADRLLHDTVLATLTVLAHQGVGVAPGELRAACARDLKLLADGVQSPQAVLIAGASAELGTSVEQLAEAAISYAAALRLEVAAHLESLEWQDVRLDSVVAGALNEALAECITNIRRHAGVDRFDLVASATGDALVVLVVDEGRGFDIVAVPEDRLGFRASVMERLSAVGGNAVIWSRPGQGTSVKLRVPVLAVAS